MARFAIIGMGKFGEAVAKTLLNYDAEVIGIDKDELLLDENKDKVTTAFCFDSTDEIALKQSGIEEADAVVVAIGKDIQANIMTCALLKKIGVGRIYAKVKDDTHRRILASLGIDNIYYPEELVGQNVAKHLVLNEISQVIELAPGHMLAEVRVPKSFIGKSLQQIDLLKKYGLNIVSTKSKVLKITEAGEKVIKDEIHSMPGANYVINEGDKIVVLGSDRNLDRFINIIKKKNN